MRFQSRRAFTLVELLVVICIIGMLAALILPAILNALRVARNAKAVALIEGLTQAGAAFHTDNGVYPPSSAEFDSRFLADALKPSPTRKPYLEFREGQLDANGAIVNPVWPDDTVRYSNNEATYPRNLTNPSVHNHASIDLWCRDSAGEAEGISNWK